MAPRETNSHHHTGEPDKNPRLQLVAVKTNTLQWLC